MTPAPEALDAPAAAVTAIRGGALRSVTYAAGVLLSLAAAPLLIRSLGRADFGIFVTITALVTIVAGVSELGLTSLGVREWAQREPAARIQLMQDLLGVRLAFIAAGIVAALAFALGAGYDRERLAATGLACVALVLQAVQSSLTIPLAGRMRQGLIGVADLVRQIVFVSLVVVLVIVDAGLVPLMAATIPAALGSLVFTAVLARDGLVVPALHPRRWRRLLAGTAAFAAAAAVSVIYFRLTLLVASVAATPEENGDFAIAFRVLEVLMTVPGLLMGALFPVFARAAVTDRDRLRHLLERTSRATIAVGGLVAVTIAAGAPVAVLVLAGSRPEEAVDALRILGIGLGAAFVGATAQFGLLAVHAHRSILYGNLAALAVNAVLTLVLAQSHGAVGAAVALATSEVVLACVATVLLHRATGPLHVGLSLPTRVVLAVAAGGGVLAALTPVSFWVAAVVAPLVTLGVTAALRAMPIDALRALRPG